jgi:transketolase
MGHAKLMRDAFFERVYEKMGEDRDVFILCDDMGAPVLDKVRAEYGDRFINVGIAEQNMLNIASGLAMEGMKVVTYAISPFYMRAYEQIRVNLAITGQLKPQNINMVGIGCGVSYDVSGPTHHCLEDISIMRTLPNIEVFSPCDHVCAAKFADYALTKRSAKYIRFDGKKLDSIYDPSEEFDFDRGFKILHSGAGGICLLSTGYMTRIAIELCRRFAERGVSLGLMDVFMLQPLDRRRIAEYIKGFSAVVTLEEAFTGKAGLDSLVCFIRNEYELEQTVRQKSIGFGEKYLFEFGERSYLYEKNGCGNAAIEKMVEEIITGGYP